MCGTYMLNLFRTFMCMHVHIPMQSKYLVSASNHVLTDSVLVCQLSMHHNKYILK